MLTKIHYAMSDNANQNTRQCTWHWQCRTVQDNRDNSENNIDNTDNTDNADNTDNTQFTCLKW